MSYFGDPDRTATQINPIRLLPQCDQGLFCLQDSSYWLLAKNGQTNR